MSVIKMNASGTSRSRFTDLSSTNASGSTVSNVMSFDRTSEQPSVATTRATTSMRVLLACSAMECAVHSSRPHESIAESTDRMQNRHTSVCQSK